MRIHTYFAVLILFCCVGGVLLFLGISWLQRDVEFARERANTCQLMDRDFSRFQDSFNQWMLLSDLILGSDMSHLLDAQNKLGKLTSAHLATAANLGLAQECPVELVSILEFLLNQRNRLDLAGTIGGTNREQRLNELLEATDAESAKVAGAIAVIDGRLLSGLEQKTHEVAQAVERHIYMSLLLATFYAGYMVLIWRWTSRTISKPVRKLAEQANEASNGHAQFLTNGPKEIGELAKSFSCLVSSLEERVQRRTAHLNEANKQLAKANLEAEQANLAKSKFLANVSHEMRTPMHGILSFAGFGMKNSDGASREKLLGYFSKINRSSQRLMVLLNDLLDLSKHEAGKTSLSLQESSLAMAIDSVLEEFEAVVKPEQRLLFVQRHEHELQVDLEKFMQVMRNLIGNALKFSPADGTVEVIMEQSADFMLVRVLDRGLGIPEIELEAVFEKFAQSSRTDTGAGGTGLGLAICREIIDLHGGRIWAEHRSGGGSIFTLELPMSCPNPVLQAPSTQ